VAPPNVSLAITDSRAQEITQAKVGDLLTLRFVITDEKSPYGIFVRELVAMDGSDTGEIVLIDEEGCPTDLSILGAVSRPRFLGDQALEAAFEAFKFPTSDTVQFRALITPCVTACEPVHCTGSKNEAISYGKRRRRRDATEFSGDQGEQIVVQTLRIAENFDKKATKAKSKEIIRSGDKSYRNLEDGESESQYESHNIECLSLRPLFAVVALFLIAQMAIIMVWLCNSSAKRKEDSSLVHLSSSTGKNLSGFPSFVSSSSSQAGGSLDSLWSPVNGHFDSGVEFWQHNRR